jgi:hypothetical protein
MEPLHVSIKILSIPDIQKGNENDATETGGRKEAASSDDPSLIVQTHRIR